ncbi:8-amino-7-oxononanoate synthase [Azospira inquinata]|uniref:8-amino-7-oxononanoate synthase n=1 Tax=Azospira inquinata TaxID=2785627 RepID=A0A975SMZ7_9RHOO|nr:8-amino-7-oxononanoate synthase [Azospira inquinata]QWT45320.1 8-amino-7-oxononanoate synthase [Azospira inquinata]QWT49348.1 8-amino-7-oxononanoate synthase [Azospira inquinata]
MIWEDLGPQLDAIDAEGLTRRRRILDSNCGPEAVVDGRLLLAFCSNDYLGLANDPRIAQAMADGALRWGAGSGAAHLVSGHLRPHHELEEALAWFEARHRAIYFSTGYMANLALVPTLVGRGDAVFADKLNHASLIDAVQLCRAESHRYPHRDMAALERLLAASEARHKLIVTDAVFSMDGDMAPLDTLYELAEKYDAWLVIDDAHGFGVLGPHGQGSTGHFGLPPSGRVLYMGTLGKAAGVSGAFIAGSARVIEWLLQRARTYIFTTASSPAVACALLKSLDIIRGEEGDQRRAHLQTLIAHLRQRLAPLAEAAGWELAASETAIQPLIIGGNQETLAVAKALDERNIWVPAIRPPTVPKGHSRLRISLSAAHTLEQVDRLADALTDIAARHPAPAPAGASA